MKRNSLSKGESRAVAALHISSITTGFISTLGLTFVAELYRAISKCPYACIFLDKTEDGSLRGFLAGTVSVNKMYRWILPRYFAIFVPLLVINLFNAPVVKKILETLNYGYAAPVRNKKEIQKEIEAELLSIAVASEFRRQGTGKKLSSMFETFLKGEDIPFYKVVTFSADTCSNRFYEKCGFRLHKQFKHHENTLNEYLKELC